MKHHNMQLRTYAREHDVSLGAISDELKISISTMHNRLNDKNLDEFFKKAFMEAVDNVEKEGK